MDLVWMFFFCEPNRPAQDAKQSPCQHQNPRKPSRRRNLPQAPTTIKWANFTTAAGSGDFFAIPVTAWI